MLNKYRLFQRANGVFYWQDNESAKQGSLRTKDRRAAEKPVYLVAGSFFRMSGRPNLIPSL